MWLNSWDELRNAYRGIIIARYGAILATVVLLLSGCAQSGESLSLKTATSAGIDAFVREHRGEEAVLLNLWAIWFAPCVEEFLMGRFDY